MKASVGDGETVSQEVGQGHVKVTQLSNGRKISLAQFLRYYILPTSRLPDIYKITDVCLMKNSFLTFSFGI